MHTCLTRAGHHFSTLSHCHLLKLPESLFLVLWWSFTDIQMGGKLDLLTCMLYFSSHTVSKCPSRAVYSVIFSGDVCLKRFPSTAQARVHKFRQHYGFPTEKCVIWSSFWPELEIRYANESLTDTNQGVFKHTQDRHRYKWADEDAVKQGFLVPNPAISPGSNDSVFAKPAFIPACRTQSITQSKAESGILKRQEATLNAPPLHTRSPQMTSKSVN